MSNLQKVSSMVNEFSVVGLRTLILAEKILTEEQYEAWNSKATKANNLIQGREEAVAKVNAEIENDLIVVGSTAIEDKLQEEVEDTIQFVKSAGIKVWVLTGDKVETAINIGFSCGLLDDKMKYKIVDGMDINLITKELDDI